MAKSLGLMLVLGAAMPVGKDETNISAWLMDVDGESLKLPEVNCVTRCYTCYSATESEMLKLSKDRCIPEVLEVFLAEMGS